LTVSAGRPGSCSGVKDQPRRGEASALIARISTVSSPGPGRAAGRALDQCAEAGKLQRLAGWRRAGYDLRLATFLPPDHRKEAHPGRIDEGELTQIEINACPPWQEQSLFELVGSDDVELAHELDQ
jgi:hypothetical protein